MPRPGWGAAGGQAPRWRWPEATLPARWHLRQQGGLKSGEQHHFQWSPALRQGWPLCSPAGRRGGGEVGAEKRFGKE